MPNIKKLIVIYARVSTAKQEEEQTIQNQLEALREFAEKNGYTIVREYSDDGWSGDVLARPDLDKLRQDAKEKGRTWDAVLIYDPDRLARRYSYQELVMDELREAEIEVIFVTTSTPKNEEDRILYGVRGLFAQYERAKITERFRLGKLRKVKEGHVLTTEAPYGYRYIPNLKIPNQPKVHGHYKINPEEERVVKMIFRWIAEEGLTLRKVVRRLQELDIKPRKSKRGVWSTGTLSTMLKNEVYIGKAHWGSSYAIVPKNPIRKEGYKKIKKSSRKIKPKEEWITADIPVPAIIDEKLFERARAQLDANFALCQRNKKNEYLLAGKIRCICGKLRGGEGTLHGKHLYYRCTDRTLSFPLPHTCKEKGISARVADGLVWKRIAELMSSPELLLKQAERWINDKQTSAKYVSVDAKQAEAEIKKIKEQEERYNMAYGAGVFTMEQLKDYIAPIREKVTALQKQIKEAEEKDRSLAKTLPNKEEIEAFAQDAASVLDDLSFAEKRAIILNVVDKVVGTQARLQIFGFVPVINNVGFKTNYRHSRPA